MIDTATAIRFLAGAKFCFSTAISRNSLPPSRYTIPRFIIFFYVNFCDLSVHMSFGTWFKGLTKLCLIILLESHAFSRQPNRE